MNWGQLSRQSNASDKPNTATLQVNFRNVGYDVEKMTR